LAYFQETKLLADEKNSKKSPIIGKFPTKMGGKMVYPSITNIMPNNTFLQLFVVEFFVSFPICRQFLRPAATAGPCRAFLAVAAGPLDEYNFT
jgi:hypothetical protein